VKVLEWTSVAPQMHDMISVLPGMKKSEREGELLSTSLELLAYHPSLNVLGCLRDGETCPPLDHVIENKFNVIAINLFLCGRKFLSQTRHSTRHLEG
jgi:hypothetical protein